MSSGHLKKLTGIGYNFRMQSMRRMEDKTWQERIWNSTVATALKSESFIRVNVKGLVKVVWPITRIRNIISSQAMSCNDGPKEQRR